MVADFAQNTHSIHTVSEFFLIHERNMKMLRDYVVEHNDVFVNELLTSIPQILPTQVQQYIEHDRGLATNKRGSILSLIKLFRNSGKEDHEILKENFDFIANRNKTIIMILNNSGF